MKLLAAVKKLKQTPSGAMIDPVDTLGQQTKPGEANYSAVTS